MLSIELTEYGLVDTLKEIKENLNEAAGKSVSKYDKDIVIYNSIGAIDALLNICLITEPIVKM